MNRINPSSSKSKRNSSEYCSVNSSKKRKYDDFIVDQTIHSSRRGAEHFDTIEESEFEQEDIEEHTEKS